ncbi:hypothetical protein HYT26_02315 [Candidatus Pacearchaeota archaeon]|nr:hypothetical protein [Candidatus Pacearchaeota archaeon]
MGNKTEKTREEKIDYFLNSLSELKKIKHSLNELDESLRQNTDEHIGSSDSELLQELKCMSNSVNLRLLSAINELSDSEEILQKLLYRLL